MNVELKLIDPRYKSKEWAVPDYKTAGAAAIDVLACIDEAISIPPGAVAMIPLGIAVHMDNTEVAAILLPRSGLGTKDGVILGNTLGLIDSDFQGQVQAPIWNRNFADPYEGGKVITINPGDRIAQLMFIPVIRPSFTIVDEFSETTERGEGGFGSTGVTASAVKVEVTPGTRKVDPGISYNKFINGSANDLTVDELISKIYSRHSIELVEKYKNSIISPDLYTFEDLRRILENTLKQRSMLYVEVHFKEIVRGATSNAVEAFLKTMDAGFIRRVYKRHYEPQPLTASFEK